MNITSTMQIIRATGTSDYKQITDDLWSKFETHLKSSGIIKEQDLSTIKRAYDLASTVHERDSRKDLKELYITHPVEVALFLINDLAIRDPELIAAALLHDAHEDHPEEVPLIKIKDEFGDRIHRIIKGLTNPEIDNETLERLNSEHDKQWAKIDFYQAHVMEAIKDDDVYVIKLSDFRNNALKLDNLASKPETQARLANKYYALIQVFRDRARECPYTQRFPWIAQEFEAALPKVESYAKSWKFYPKEKA